MSRIDDDEFSIPFCASRPCPTCDRARLDCLAVIFDRVKRERFENATNYGTDNMSRPLTPAEIAWMDELKDEAKRRAFPLTCWPPTKRSAGTIAWWLEDYHAKGLTPAQALDRETALTLEATGLTVAELHEVEAEMQEDYDASMASLPPVSDEPDDIPF